MAAVAERLRAGDAAVFERQTVRVPGEIFTAHVAVADGHVAAVPERVLGVERAVFENGVLYILKRILAAEAQAAHIEILGAQEKVLALRRAVAQYGAVRRPAELGRYYVAPFQPGVAALAQRLYAVHFRVLYRNVFRIPQRGAAVFSHVRAAHGDVAVVPERVAQIEKAVLGDDVRALLERAFAVGRAVEPAPPHRHAAAAVQRPLGVKSFVFDYFHSQYFPSHPSGQRPPRMR